MKKTKKWYLSGLALVLAMVAIVAGLDGSSFNGWEDSYSSVAGSKAAPAKTFLATSFTKTAAADRYNRVCVTTAGTATATTKLTKDEQAQFDAFNKAVPKFKTTTIATLISSTSTNKNKYLFSSTEKTNILGTKSVQIYVDSNAIYYPGSKKGTWKGFKDKNTVDAIFKSVKSDDVTSYFDKKSMSFVKWDTTGKTASYSGKVTADGNAAFISDAFGDSLVAGQDLALAKLYIDEKTQLWSKYEAVVSDLKTGKIKFPLNGVCQITYGNAVQIKIPTGVTWVDAKTGAKEMLDAVNAVVQ